MIRPLAPSLALFCCLSRLGMAAPVIVNEFNTVSSSQMLVGGGVDSSFGEVVGNGGDWFELVVVGTGVGSSVDMRGWKLEIKRVATVPFVADDVIVLSNALYWSNVPAGTILTFTESRSAEGGMDTSLDDTDLRATEGWAHSNIWVGDPTLITYTDSATNGYDLDPVSGVNGVNLNDEDTQIRILNAFSVVVFGPAGEGVQPVGDEISKEEMFALQQTPSSSVTPSSDYGDTSKGVESIAYSSFGRPNRWLVGGETFDQSFTGFQPGGAAPVILSSQADLTILTGDPFSYPIQALDADGDPIAISVVQGPGFLGLTDNNNGTGLLAGTPTLAQAGTYVVKLQVSDNDDGIHQQAFVLTVLPRTAPVIVNEYNAVSTSAILAQDWSFDQRFGRVTGNGDDWIELVVTGDGSAGSTIDMRGWRIEVLEDGAPAGTIKLTNHAFWQSVQAGMILTFTESDTVGGGMDTSLSAEDRLALEGWAWSNVHIGDAALVDKASSSTNIGIVGDATRITIFNDSDGAVAGPYGEGLFSASAVDNTKVFRLTANPLPTVHPLNPQFGAADTSSFGHPNRLPENDGTVAGKPAGSGTGYQLFAAFATGAHDAAPYFTNLWGTPDINNTLPGSTWNGLAITVEDPDHLPANLSFSLVSPPAGLSLIDHGDGTAELSWTPSAGQTGIHDIVVKVSDPNGASLTRSFPLAVLPSTSPVLVNEYNGVSSSRFLNGGTVAEDLDGGIAMDSFFGRIIGNGGDWIELVVVGNGTANSTVDMRGWKIEVTSDTSPPETIVLSQHAYFSAVRAGTIITFVESDVLGGGIDSAIHRVNRFSDLGYAWTNIVVGDAVFVDQLASTLDGSITINDADTEIILRNAGGAIVNGPAGESRITRNVNGSEVFHLESNPAPNVTASVADPGFPNYADNNESSSFGAPNRWQEDVLGIPTEFEQGFVTFLSFADTNSIPTFTQLPTFFYGVPGRTHSQPVKAVDFDGSAALGLSLINSPAWVSLTDNGSGNGSVEWTPTGGVSGFHDVSVMASDGVDSFVRTFTIFIHQQASVVILNEYNAVSGNGFLNDGTLAMDSMGGTASDEQFGRVAGNGGDWFELVVTGDDGPGALDMRGWTIEVAADAGFPFAAKAVIELSNDPFWAAVPHGMILTFTEERASGGGMDTSIGEIDQFATAGWGWSNIWIGDSQYVTYSDALTNGYLLDPMSGDVSNFDITGVRTQFAVRDAGGGIVCGPAGEGIAPDGGISSRNVWELVGDPRSTVTPHDLADLGVPEFGAAASVTESSFGHPNKWSAGAAVQDFSVFVSPYAVYVGAAGLSGSDALMGADPDGDRYTNGQEFAHGTNPNDPGSLPEFRASVGASFSLTFLRRAGGSMVGNAYQVDGIELEVHYSTDLTSWDVTALQGTVPGGLPAPPAGYEYVTFLLPPGVFASAERAFMRVVFSG